MAYKVKVVGACSCFLKSGLPEISEFETKEKAKSEAEEIYQRMNTTFCHKHKFKLNEIGMEFIITVR